MRNKCYHNNRHWKNNYLGQTSTYQTESTFLKKSLEKLTNQNIIKVWSLTTFLSLAKAIKSKIFRLTLRYNTINALSMQCGTCKRCFVQPKLRSKETVSCTGQTLKQVFVYDWNLQDCRLLTSQKSTSRQPGTLLITFLTVLVGRIMVAVESPRLNSKNEYISWYMDELFSYHHET
jgi:hypothetical protein